MQNPFGNRNNQQDFLKNLPVPPNYAKVVDDNGDIRIAKVGISWTTLWFGPLPAVFRGDWYNFALILVWEAIYVLFALLTHLELYLLSFPWPAIFFAFFYNMMYFRHLFTKGYSPADQRSRELLIKSKYLKQ